MPPVSSTRAEISGIHARLERDEPRVVAEPAQPQTRHTLSRGQLVGAPALGDNRSSRKRNMWPIIRTWPPRRAAPWPSPFEQDQLGGHAALLERLLDLNRLAGRHARVVDALDDQQRRLDAVEVRRRRELLQRVGVLLGIAVLAGAERAAVRRGVLKERREVRDADDGHAGVVGAREHRHAHEHRVAAVAAAGDRDLRRLAVAGESRAQGLAASSMSVITSRRFGPLSASSQALP